MGALFNSDNTEKERTRRDFDLRYRANQFVGRRLGISKTCFGYSLGSYHERTLRVLISPKMSETKQDSLGVFFCFW